MLPLILTMGFTGMAGIGLWVRRYMVDEFNSDYVKFARSKGLSEGRILSVHILRNAVVPLVRTFPSAVIGALFGSYYLENIYSINGIGGAVMTAINQKESSLLIFKWFLISFGITILPRWSTPRIIPLYSAIFFTVFIHPLVHRSDSMWWNRLFLLCRRNRCRRDFA